MGELMLKAEIKGRIMKKGFTLVETLITLAIFSIVIIMGSSAFAIGYVTGNPASIAQKRVNRDMETIMETIRYKIQTANKKDKLGPDDVWGFRVYPNQNLFNDGGTYNMIVTSSNTTDSNNQCTYIILDKSDFMLKMSQSKCKNLSGNDSVRKEDFSPISSGNIKITNFSFTNSEWEYNDTEKKIPKFTLTITGKDKKLQNQLTLKDTYILPYEVAEGM